MEVAGKETKQQSTRTEKEKKRKYKIGLIIIVSSILKDVSLANDVSSKLTWNLRVFCLRFF